MLSNLSVLNNLNNGKVTIYFNTECSTGITYTYDSFIWTEDEGNECIALGDAKSTNEDVTNININEIQDIIVNDNLNSIELILTNGSILLVLDEHVSLCCKCKRNRPVFYIRAYNAKSDEYDIRICQDCFEKMMNIKK